MASTATVCWGGLDVLLVVYGSAAGAALLLCFGVSCFSAKSHLSLSSRDTGLIPLRDYTKPNLNLDTEVPFFVARTCAQLLNVGSGDPFSAMVVPKGSPSGATCFRNLLRCGNAVPVLERLSQGQCSTGMTTVNQVQKVVQLLPVGGSAWPSRNLTSTPRSGPRAMSCAAARMPSSTS